MDIIIWGVAALGKYLANNIFHNDINIKPLAFVDNNPELWGNSVNDIPVISYDELMKRGNLSNICILLAISGAQSIFEVLEQIKNVSWNRIGIVKLEVLYSNLKVDPYKEKGEVIWSLFQGKMYPVIPRIEVNLIDACNLKCKSCSHFASIYNEDSIYQLKDYESDLLQLKKIGQILRLRLLGGEPFLLDNLDEYVELTRKIFETTDVEIVTNGLLIPNVNERIMLALKTNSIRITISPYKPTLKRKKEIVDCLDKYGISWYFEGEEILTFYRGLTLKNTHNAENSSKACLASGCVFLKKGKLFKCPVDGLINDFYGYYKLNIKHDSGINIYQDRTIVLNKIVDYALKPVEMCKYCAEKPEQIPWSVESKPLLKDWLYKDGDRKEG